MTRWTIDGKGDTGTRATHYVGSKAINYNVSRSGRFWISEATYPDGSSLIIGASEPSEAAAHARCEFHAANLHSSMVSR